jgi:hypothetical protein
MKYAVVSKVTERTGPSSTSFGGKVIDVGEVLDLSDVVETVNERWGKIKNRARAYIAINIGELIYCVPLKPLPDPNVLDRLIQWAEAKGFRA